MIVNSWLLLLPELIMTATAVLIFLLDAIWRGGERSARWSSILAAAGLAATIIAALLLLPLASHGPLMMAFDDGHHIPMMAFDGLAVFFKLFAAIVVLAISIISFDYLKERTPYRGEFLALTIFTGLAIMLVTAGANLIFIYLSFEFLSITSYVLTGYLKTDVRSTEGSIKYFLYGSVASAVMLYGLSLLYGATGSVDLATIGVALDSGDASLAFLAGPAFILILVGIGFKIALVPFHQWSPDAYEGAPTPITAFLSVGPKAAGLGLIIRLLAVAFPAFSQSWVAILTAVSIITMTVGNLIAMQQSNIKRMMAYSSIAQAGYIIIGVAALAPGSQSFTNGLNGVLLYLMAYLFTNLGAFAVIIAIENKIHSADIADYAGLVKRAPFLSLALFIFFMSLIGIPPTGGFMGKLFVFSAAIQKQMFALAVVGIINSVISVVYYFGVLRQVFFTEAKDAAALEVPRYMTAVVAVSLVVVLAIALAGQPFVDFATRSVQILSSGL